VIPQFDLVPEKRREAGFTDGINYLNCKTFFQVFCAGITSALRVTSGVTGTSIATITATKRVAQAASKFFKGIVCRDRISLHEANGYDCSTSRLSIHQLLGYISSVLLL
jgi:hypothetical protein